ncbi:MAG: nicotinate (nicotinamide) nucleotide adenylyltransferase [Gammaproteobacteria bacterium]|nr:nicotinate (nicotinamide) nucleotide adenylyltransferase [Gammaproteobacteria bacterium]
MPSTIPLVLFGGSFDPIHESHLWMAHTVFQQLTHHGIQPEIRFLPTACSPFKTTQTSAKHRLTMLKLALRDTPFLIDKTEIHLPPPNFTIDTLGLIRARIGLERPLIFVMGQDSLESLPRWKGGFELLDKTHLWIFPRMNSDKAESVMLDDALQSRQVLNVENLSESANGLIYLDHQTPPNLSSSEVREHAKKSDFVKLLKKSLPPRVFEYNRKTKLYGGTTQYES